MGVPAFAKWLTERYPLIFQNININQLPNIDNLYLDMNGIIYKVVQDESIMFKDLLMPQKFEELFAQIFNYINEIINSVGPNKVLFLGFDGPAPRAKQNQQRSRRFQSAKSHGEVIRSLENCGFLSKGQTVKNNSISPGTEFMHNLNKQIEFFIARKFKEDEKWADLKVIFSGSNVPGEGEHKILNYMRSLASQEEYDMNTSHCIYGADADLIFLGLSTRIPYITILKEELPPYVRNPVVNAAKREQKVSKFQIIYLNMLREYMDQEFKLSKNSFKHLEYDIDRIIDDFILLFFFIGNDFLPKCYCFDIRKGQVEELMDAYKNLLQNSESYINDKGTINWKAMEMLLELLQGKELEFIKSRAKELEDFYNKNKLDQNDYDNIDDDICDDNDDEIQKKFDTHTAATFNADEYNALINKKKQAKAKLVKQEIDFMQNLELLTDQFDFTIAKKAYYKEKLQINIGKKEDDEIVTDLLQKYCEGLEFVLKYYYEGLPSWSWYFPYYYSPFVSDLHVYIKEKNQKEGVQVKFDKGQPFEPYQALITIIHPENYALLPPVLQNLIKSPDSPLRSPIDYFPNQFRIDPFGGIWSHEYIVSLPFLPEDVLKKAYESVDFSQLSDEDKARNQLGMNTVYSLNKNKKAQRYKIESTLPYYQSFEIALNKVEFTLDIQIKCNIHNDIKPYDEKRTFIFPSIHQKKIEDIQLQVSTNKMKKIFIEYKQEVFIPSTTPNNYIPVYTHFPCPKKGYIIGWMDNKQLYKIKARDYIKALDEQNYSQQNHQQLFNYLVENLRNKVYGKDGIMDKDNKVQNILAIVRYYPTIERELNGAIVENTDLYDSEEFLLPTLFSKQLKYRVKGEIPFFKNLEQEFPLNSKVLTFESKYLGCKGRVIGYEQGKRSKQVKVELFLGPKQFEDKSNMKLCNNNEYYKLDYVAKKLKCHPEVILHLIDSVPIDIDQTRKSAHNIKPRVDIGLRFIDRRLNEIVHEYVRIQKGQFDLQGYNRFKQFSQKLEISKQGVELLVQYFNQIKNTRIIQQLEDCIKLKDHYPKLTVNQIFEFDEDDESFDPNIQIVQIYLWIVENSKTFVLQPINGEVVSQQAIQNYLKKNNNIKPYKMKKQIVIDPNFLQRECDYVYIPMYFKEHPFWHEVGDRVVNLNSTAKSGVPPFGASGTVVGTSLYHIQVIFDQPFIGGTNLGGKCEWLRGATLEFLDVYNLEQDSGNSWNSCLQNRDMKQLRVKGWDRIVQPCEPQSRQQPIGDDRSHNLFLNALRNQQDVNVFQQINTDNRRPQNQDQQQKTQVQTQTRPKKNQNNQFQGLASDDDDDDEEEEPQTKTKTKTQTQSKPQTQPKTVNLDEIENNIAPKSENLKDQLFETDLASQVTTEQPKNVLTLEEAEQHQQFKNQYENQFKEQEETQKNQLTEQELEQQIMLQMQQKQTQPKNYTTIADLEQNSANNNGYTIQSVQPQQQQQQQQQQQPDILQDLENQLNGQQTQQQNQQNQQQNQQNQQNLPKKPKKKLQMTGQTFQAPNLQNQSVPVIQAQSIADLESQMIAQQQGYHAMNQQQWLQHQQKLQNNQQRTQQDQLLFEQQQAAYQQNLILHQQYVNTGDNAFQFQPTTSQDFMQQLENMGINVESSQSNDQQPSAQEDKQE